jgi:hypothetical protein
MITKSQKEIEFHCQLNTLIFMYFTTPIGNLLYCDTLSDTENITGSVCLHSVTVKPV